MKYGYPYNLLCYVFKVYNVSGFTESYVKNIEYLISEFPEDYQQLIYLRYNCGNSFENCAKEMGKSLGTVQGIHATIMSKLNSRKFSSFVKYGNIEGDVVSFGNNLKLDVSILGISGRFTNCLYRNGIMTVGDLVSRVEEDVEWYKSVKGLGSRAICNINEKLESFCTGSSILLN